MTPEEQAERNRDRATAALWRELMEPDHGDGRTVERLRDTARRAVEDWLEVRGR